MKEKSIKEKGFLLIDKNNKYFVYDYNRVKFHLVEKEEWEKYKKHLKGRLLPDKIEKNEIQIGKFHHLTICVCDFCNLKCKYCYERNYYNSIKKSFLSGEDMFKIYKNIIKEYPLGIEEISFFGGEPLLGFNNIKEFINLITTYNEKNKIGTPKFGIITNGTLINKEIFVFLKKYNFVVTISLDGDKEINDYGRIFNDSEKSVYEKVIDNITKFDFTKEIVTVGEATLPIHFFEKCSKIKVYEYIDKYLKLGFSSFFPFVVENPSLLIDRKLRNNIYKFYLFFTRYWLDALVTGDKKYKSIPPIIIKLINRLTGSIRVKACGSGSTGLFLGTNKKFYKCQFFYKSNLEIQINELSKDNGFKPNYKKCEDCIAKYVCMLWCPGGQELNGRDLVDTRCIAQQAMVEATVRWLSKLNERKLKEVFNNIQRRNTLWE